MGNDQSNQEAKDFFQNLGNGIVNRVDKYSNAVTNTLNAPANLANSLGSFLTSPTSGIILPIVALGGLYIVMNFKR